MNCITSINSSCCISKDGGEFEDKFLNGLIAHYIEFYHPDHVKEIEYFSNSNPITEAIKKAVQSEINGILASHQRRIGKGKLNNSVPKFLEKEDQFVAAKTFEKIYNICRNICDGIKGLGVLAAYDFADRIAAYKGISPQDIYIHAGVKTGLRNLGYRQTVKISKDEICRTYHEFKKLDARGCENFLCIFKDKVADYKRL